MVFVDVHRHHSLPKLKEWLDFDSFLSRHMGASRVELKVTDSFAGKFGVGEPHPVGPDGDDGLRLVGYVQKRKS